MKKQQKQQKQQQQQQQQQQHQQQQQFKFYTKIYSQLIHTLEEISPYPTQKTLNHPQLVSCRFPIRVTDSFAKSKAVSFNWTLEEVTAWEEAPKKGQVDHEGIGIFVQKWT